MNNHLFYNYSGDLKKAVDVAEFYGFRLVPPPAVVKEDRAHAEKHGCPEPHLAVLRLAAEEQPHAASGAAFLAHTRKVPYKTKLELRLDVIGDRESSAENLLLSCARAILAEYGHRDTSVSLNSIGGKETVPLFAQAVASHFRRHLGDLDAECREDLKRSPFAPLRCSHAACKAIRAHAPQSLNFLSEQAKRHFRDILEYLETADIPYAIDPSLVGSEHYTTRTIFHIGVPSSAEGAEAWEHERPLAVGERYDSLSKKMGARTTTPAVHITIDPFARPRAPRERYAAVNRERPLPPFFVVHSGLQAKARVLCALEALRAGSIRVLSLPHAVAVGAQMEAARAAKSPVVIVIGHKEACENTALVRVMATNRQECVPLAGLAAYLKRLA